MKTIVFGDIHGRRIWKDIIKIEYDADRYVFLGDYVGTHDRNMTSEQQIDNLNDLLNWVDEMNKYTPGRVILLRGNHDMQHLGYPWASCSGLDLHVQADMMKLKDRFLDATQWVYVDGNIVFSHAGITQRWWTDMQKLYPQLQKFEDVNHIDPSNMFGFRSDKMGDYTGIRPTQPLTWVRPSCLCEYGFPDITYVVGHTTQSSISNYKEELMKYEELKEFAKCDVWVCDTLPREYLLIDDGKFIPVKIEM